MAPVAAKVPPGLCLGRSISVRVRIRVRVRVRDRQGSAWGVELLGGKDVKKPAPLLLWAIREDDLPCGGGGMH